VGGARHHQPRRERTPASRLALPAPDAGDAIADAPEAGVLVSRGPARRRVRGWICSVGARLADRDPVAGDGAPGQVKPLSDLLPDHPVLAAQACDHGEPGRGHFVGDQVRCRAAVLQAGNAFAAKAGEPLTHGACGELERGREGCYARPSSSTRRTITARPNGVAPASRS
jgi:hypothetical protein